MPIVSVIIPAYNAAPFLAETLASALGQTLADIEVIVVDDGSKDHTAQVAQSFPAVRYVHQQNAGVSAARNTGAAHARGEFLAFLDSDDLWHPDKLRQQVEALRQHPDSVFCRTEAVSDPTRQAEIVGGPRASGAPHELIPDFHTSFLVPYLTTSTVMVRRSAFEAAGGFDTRLRIAEDVDFYLRVLVRQPLVVKMTQALVYKRPVPGSLGDDSVAGYHQLLKVYDRFLASHPEARQVIGPERIEQAYHKLYLDLARSHLWIGENREAWQAAWQARRHGPLAASLPLMAKACVPAWLRERLGSRRSQQA
jgi:glycosyltransferase involved in cell wall biosynthesis